MNNVTRSHAGPVLAALVLAALSLGTLPRTAQAQFELVGRWTGTFDFIVLGERAQRGPAAVFNKGLREFEGEPARLGEGSIDVRIVNRVGDHFFGRWSVGGRSADFVCTLRDPKDFVCAGRNSSAVGSVKADGNLRICWTASGDNATSGCADLVRPS